MAERRRINRVHPTLSRPLTILGAERKLFFFAMYLGAASRRFFLKNTGCKLSHLDKQFNVSHADMLAPVNEEDFN
jgi:hypothetical protein